MTKHYKMPIGAALACTILSACSTSLVVSESPANLNADEAVSGIPYRLPVAEYNIKLTYSLEECGGAVEATTPSVDMLRNAIEMKVSAEIVSSIRPGEQLTVAYLASGAWNKTSKVEIKRFDNGILKSVNASSTDKTTEIISSVVSSGFKVARIASGIPISTSENIAEKPKKFEFCSKATKDLLTNLKSAEQAVETQTGELEEKQVEAERLKLQALIGGLSPAQQEKAELLAKEITGITKKLNLAQELLKFYQKQLSTSVEFIFVPTTQNIADGKNITFASENIWKWLKPMADECAKELIDGDPAKEACGSSAKGQSWKADFARWSKADLDVVIVTTGPDNDAHTNISDASLKKVLVANRKEFRKNAGIQFREPVRAKIKLCAGDDALACVQSTQPIAVHEANVPQLGAWQSLPLHNGFGQDNELSATFLEDGMLVEAKYEEKSAPGEKAAKVVDDLVSQYGSYDEARRAKAKQDIADAKSEAKVAKEEALAAETAELDKEITRLTKAKQLLELQTAIDTTNADRKPSELLQLEAELAILRAKKERQELIEAIGNGD